MGRSRRQSPSRLPSKLREIRLKLNLTQQEMAERLVEVKAGLQPGHVSEYETGRRQPSLLLVFAYAKEAGVPMDFLVDDRQDLPATLPALFRKTWDDLHA
jgi:transcriptional regulator with XRE-family HTH domain